MPKFKVKKKDNPKKQTNQQDAKVDQGGDGSSVDAISVSPNKPSNPSFLQRSLTPTPKSVSIKKQDQQMLSPINLGNQAAKANRAPQTDISEVGVEQNDQSEDGLSFIGSKQSVRSPSKSPAKKKTYGQIN